MHTITATDLARRTRQILDVVVSQRETIVVERNHVTIATIAPSESTMTARQVLAGFRPTLTRHQADAWLKESRGGFGDEIADPWG